MSAEDAIESVVGDAAEGAAWHRMLRERDAQVHHEQTEIQISHAVADLELRLVRANATQHALQQAVILRDRILREQQLRMSELERELTHLQGEALNPSVRTSLRRLAGRARRAARRVVDIR